MMHALVASMFWPGASWFGAGLLLGGALGWLASRIYSSWGLAKHAKEIQTLAVQARTDPLTGLANRRVLEDELVRRLALWREQKTPLVLVLADIDHFKPINGDYGYAAGDASLKHLASVMTSTLRQTDLVARFGGDEFAILLTAAGEEPTALALARVQRAIAEAPPLFNGEPLPITVSFGAVSPEQGMMPAELFRRADAALNAAKRHGRDCTFWHDGREAKPLATDRVVV
ncbi:MAG TPA: GGDEF domain-containing protein [Pirellulaceae bacterium]|nr:GGDEF domain-containing protein [Pirellulaceae bacterium]